MRRALAALTAVALAHAAPALAQEPPDPLDFSGEEARLERSGLPTVADVARLRELAEAAFADGDCEKALPIIVEWTRHANALASILRKTLAPFYNADYDSRKTWAPSSDVEHTEWTVKILIDARNLGWVMEAECRAKAGDAQAAAARFMRALDYIGLRDRALWERARRGLWAIVGHHPENP